MEDQIQSEIKVYSFPASTILLRPEKTGKKNKIHAIVPGDFAFILNYKLVSTVYNKKRQI